MGRKQIISSLLLLVTSIIWGLAFVAQSVSMDYIEPFTFICLRSVIGGLALLPVIRVYDRLKVKQEENDLINSADSEMSQDSGPFGGWSNPQLWRAGIICGLFLFLANCCQQTGIQYTTAGKAGFITAFYIVIVPVLGIFFRKKCGLLTWIGVVIALAGLYLLCITERMTIQQGDLLVLLCAFMFSGQILSIDHFAGQVDGMKMACIQFFVGAVLAFFCMFLFEKPDIHSIMDAAIPILYTGIMSTGVGYTLQIIGQKNLNPTVASLIMSLESVFSVLAGYLILHEVLTFREGIGCVLMFIAVILAQLPDRTAVAE